jgi:hypothetical protein
MLQAAELATKHLCSTQNAVLSASKSSSLSLPLEQLVRATKRCFLVATEPL